MSAFAPFTEVQFQQLAMAKARGFSWTMMATCLEMPLEVIERVPWTHAKLWSRHLAKAERLVAREAIAEVVGFLRRDVAEAESKLRPTIVNSLSRVLKLQQEFAPQRRRVPATGPVAPVPVAAAPPNVSTPPPEEKPLPADLPKLEPLAALRTTASSLVGVFLLVCALLLGCWSGAKRLAGAADERMSEPVATMLDTPCERVSATTNVPVARVVWMPPPWLREPDGPCPSGT